MVQSVELVLDGLADAMIREQWATLADAGLPSQAHHRSPTNAPHITVAEAASVDDDVEARLANIPARFPLPITIGPLLVFGSARFVLVRLVIPNAALLAAHAVVADAFAESPGQSELLAPGRWVPHVTLAHRLTAEQLGHAVELLASGPMTYEAEAVAPRRFDSEARRTWIIGA